MYTGIGGFRNLPPLGKVCCRPMRLRFVEASTFKNMLLSFAVPLHVPRCWTNGKSTTVYRVYQNVTLQRRLTVYRVYQNVTFQRRLTVYRVYQNVTFQPKVDCIQGVPKCDTLQRRLMSLTKIICLTRNCYTNVVEIF